MASETVVTVTGANGFIGSHVCKQLLENGYIVHGTVRDANDQKNQFLEKLAEDQPGTLKLFTASLETPGSFEEAVQEADYVIHTAAVLKLTAKNPQREVGAMNPLRTRKPARIGSKKIPQVRIQIIDIPKEGLMDVLKTCSKVRKQNQKLKCFVHTSSIAAICDRSKPQEHVYTEEDWNETATVKTGPYDKAKTEAEKAVMEYVKNLPEDEKFRLVGKL